MTLEQLLGDEALRRREFPVAAEKVFVAHAAVTALPRCAVEAINAYLADCTRNDQEECFPPGRALETRRLAAQLLGCTPQEIALVGPTSLALSLVANGLDFPPGSNIICYRDDYPANVYPWRSTGVEVRSVKPKRLGEITLESVAEGVDKNTRLVALASAHFLSGYRLDIAGIGKFLRERGVLFCVDGIQTLGALRTTVEHVDFLAADSHKWLLGPNASGILFVRREHFERLRPTLFGWANVACPGYIAQDEMKLPPHAGRYECGSQNLIGIVGLHASLKLLTDIGIEAIERRVLANASFLIARLQARGYEIVGPTGGAAMSGIVSCRKSGVDIAALRARLLEKNIVASARDTRDGGKLLRFSPHFYNTEAELARVVEALL